MNKKLEGKRLLIMGGMQISCEIVRKAKSMGVFTIVADYYPVGKSPAKKIADESWNINITDNNTDCQKHQHNYYAKHICHI